MKHRGLCDTLCHCASVVQKIFSMVEIILTLVAVYLLLGVLFVIPFLMKGLSKIDEGVNGSTIGFKIIIIPGVIVFWPVLLKSWVKNLKHGGTKAQRNTEKAH